MEIIYTDWGIANCFSKGNERWIELNKDLKNYPELHDSVLRHELEHFNSENKNLDFAIDFKEANKFNWELTKFMLKHPKSLTQLIPFVVNKKGFFPDYFMILVYITAMALGIIAGVAIF